MSVQVEIMKYCGVALLCAASSLILQQFDRRGDTAVRVGGAVLLLGASFSLIVPLADYVSKTFTEGGITPEAVGALLRILGVAVAGRAAADLCREMGAPGIASALETTARAGILWMTLPLIRSALETVGSLLAVSASNA